MKLTLVQWKALEAQATQIRKQLEALESEIMLLAVTKDVSDDRESFKHFFKLTQYLDTARMATLSVYNGVAPISEWVGNEAWKWREPISCYGGLSARRYFTPEEVAAWERQRNAPPSDGSSPAPPAALSTDSPSSP